MKTIKQFNISLIIRSIIIPIILIATLIGGYRLNGKIVSLIDFGFTVKLATLSSTTGAFVQLDDHQVLIKPRSAYNIRKGWGDSWFVLSSEGFIHELFTDGSMTLDPILTFVTTDKPIISFAVKKENLYSVDTQGTITKWDSLGQSIRQIRQALESNAKIATSEVRPEILIGPDSNGFLNIMDQDLNLVSRIESPSDSIFDFNIDANGSLTVLTENQQLITMDPVSGATTSQVFISCQNTDACPQIHSIASIDTENYWGLSSALTLLNTNGSIDSDFYAHEGYQDHTSERYLRYVIPMREVREKQELTYLYSFNLNDEDKTISYVLDSSTDQDFTHIGYVDYELSLEDYIAATDVLLTTKAYISKIKPWGQWGLVKIGFAPIFRDEGGGAAIMGADQNVSSIDQVSREALVILSLSSFVFLLFGATASWFIAKSLTSPLLALKDNVLGIAAGFLDRLVLEPSFKDLQPLAEVFKEAGDNLKKEVIQGPVILKKFDELRLKQDYRSYLDLKLRDYSKSPFKIEVEQAFANNVAWAISKNNTLLWFIESAKSPQYELQKSHNTVYQTAIGISGISSGQHSAVELLDNLFTGKLSFVIEIDHKSGAVEIISSDKFLITQNSISDVAQDPLNVHIMVTKRDTTKVFSLSKRSES